MTVDTNPEALAALRESLTRYTGPWLVPAKAADVIAALEAERDRKESTLNDLVLANKSLTEDVNEVIDERDAALTLLESDAPDGRKVTNAQYVEVTTALRAERDAALARATMSEAVLAGDRVLMNEQAALLRECRAALDALILQKPTLAGLLCGSTTLGNLKAELGAYRPQGVIGDAALAEVKP